MDFTGLWITKPVVIHSPNRYDSQSIIEGSLDEALWDFLFTEKLAVRTAVYVAKNQPNTQNHDIMLSNDFVRLGKLDMAADSLRMSIKLSVATLYNVREMGDTQAKGLDVTDSLLDALEDIQTFIVKLFMIGWDLPELIRAIHNINKSVDLIISEETNVSQEFLEEDVKFDQYARLLATTTEASKMAQKAIIALIAAFTSDLLISCIKEILLQISKRLDETSPSQDPIARAMNALQGSRHCLEWRAAMQNSQATIDEAFHKQTQVAQPLFQSDSNKLNDIIKSEQYRAALTSPDFAEFIQTAKSAKVSFPLLEQIEVGRLQDILNDEQAVTAVNTRKRKVESSRYSTSLSGSSNKNGIAFLLDITNVSFLKLMRNVNSLFQGFAVQPEDFSEDNNTSMTDEQLMSNEPRLIPMRELIISLDKLAEDVGLVNSKFLNLMVACQVSGRKLGTWRIENIVQKSFIQEVKANGLEYCDHCKVYKTRTEFKIISGKLCCATCLDLLEKTIGGTEARSLDRYNGVDHGISLSQETRDAVKATKNAATRDAIKKLCQVNRKDKNPVRIQNVGDTHEESLLQEEVDNLTQKDDMISNIAQVKNDLLNEKVSLSYCHDKTRLRHREESSMGRHACADWSQPKEGDLLMFTLAGITKSEHTSDDLETNPHFTATVLADDFGDETMPEHHVKPQTATALIRSLH